MGRQTRVVETDPLPSLTERREYMRLPLEERRKRLAAQAERMAEHYEEEAERAERELWQGGDIVEP